MGLVQWNRYTEGRVVVCICTALFVITPFLLFRRYSSHWQCRMPTMNKFHQFIVLLILIWFNALFSTTTRIRVAYKILYDVKRYCVLSMFIFLFVTLTFSFLIRCQFVCRSAFTLSNHSIVMTQLPLLSRFLVLSCNSCRRTSSTRTYFESNFRYGSMKSIHSLCFHGNKKPK